MRVKISYGMDIEKVPKETERLIEEAISELSTSIKVLEAAKETLCDAKNIFFPHISLIDTVRQNLSSADLILVDSQAILTGLDNYYNGEEDVSEGRPIVDPSGNTTTQTKDNGEG